MLTHLRIRDLIVVEEADLEFAAGYNVLSGSTGAGKSVLLAALALVTGARARTDWIKTGAERARVEAFFRLEAPLAQRLAELGFACQDGELQLTRELRRDGHGQAFFEGFPLSVNRLRLLGECLVERQDQHEQLSLTEPDRQLALLDEYADAHALLARYRRDLEALSACVRDEEALRADLERLRRDEEYLRFQLAEIDALAPESGELEDLEAKERLLRNAARIQEALGEGLAILEGGPRSMLEQVGALSRLSRRLEKWDADLAWPDLEGLAEGLKALAQRARDQAQRVRSDAHEGERLAARLGKLHALERKHSLSLGEILAWAAGERERLAGLAEGERLLAGRQALSQEARERLSASASGLSRHRREAAARLGKAWEAELRLLGLERCRLRIALEQREDERGEVLMDGRRFRAGERGIDRAEITVRTNPDLPEGALRDVPSGGELSRIALARHLLGIGAQAAPLLVLDEVDAGLGADTAHLLAEHLRALSGRRQIILVTHQAPLAAAAERQFSVRKHFAGGRTQTRVEVVLGEERTLEIARMLGETRPGQETRDLARALLERRQGPESRPVAKGRPARGGR